MIQLHSASLDTYPVLTVSRFILSSSAPCLFANVFSSTLFLHTVFLISLQPMHHATCLLRLFLSAWVPVSCAGGMIFLMLFSHAVLLAPLFSMSSIKALPQRLDKGVGGCIFRNADGEESADRRETRTCSTGRAIWPLSADRGQRAGFSTP